MEAKDTVLSNGSLLKMFGTTEFTEREGREKQAEVPFEAGKRAGVREIVEHLRSVIANTNYIPASQGGHDIKIVGFKEKVWETKLKEWGINTPP